MMMLLDSKLDPRYVGKAVRLLNAGGYDRATSELLAGSSLGAVAGFLAGASPRRQKTVIELIESAMDDSQQ